MALVHFSVFLHISLISCFFISPCVNAELLDKVVANVDGSPVLYSELATEFKKISPEFDGVRALREDELKFGLTAYLINKEAQKYGLVVSSEEVEAHIDEVIAQNNLTRERFNDALIASGTSLENYKAKLVSEITRNRVISTVLKQRIQVNNEELQSYIETGSGDNASDEDSFGLYKIESLVKEFDKEEESKKLKTFLMGGGVCEKYPSQYFKSCENLGVFKAKDLKEAYANALEGTELFALSDIFNENGLNYVLFKVDSKVSQSLSKTGQSLKDKLLQEKFKQEAEKYLSKEIFDTYHVEFHF